MYHLVLETTVPENTYSAQVTDAITGEAVMITHSGDGEAVTKLESISYRNNGIDAINSMVMLQNDGRNDSSNNRARLTNLKIYEFDVPSKEITVNYTCDGQLVGTAKVHVKSDANEYSVAKNALVNGTNAKYYIESEQTITIECDTVTVLVKSLGSCSKSVITSFGTLTLALATAPTAQTVSVPSTGVCLALMTEWGVAIVDVPSIGAEDVFNIIAINAGN